MKTALRRGAVALGLAFAIACGLGAQHAAAQSIPIVVPVVPPVIVGIPGVHGHAGIWWTTSGRADVDVDVERSTHHGQAVAR